ncbi:MAG: hypothetical protein COA50_16485 [Flavobacteriaceae bacterium]|nr:MAG: hypothetical protein COA50_16485 [Flavobacteriaceae bacterium]
MQKKKNRNSIFTIILVTVLGCSQLLSAQVNQKDRVIILTDIEADPDDTQSLVRLFLYSNEIDIKGIVATTSCWYQSRINPESITKVIQAYGKVYPNLTKHAGGFPVEETLQALVKNGLPKYGMLGVGDGQDSEGSDWIIKTLEEKDDRPLWISVWGGVNTLAQALDKIQKTKSKKIAKKLIEKLRVYTISDQDDSGIWIRNNFPDLFYIVSPGDHYGSATWTGINFAVDGIDNSEISNSWIAENIQKGHGPLGTEYPDVAWGVEGDTPAFLSLIPNGLNNSEHPEWGGWGGRLRKQPGSEKQWIDVASNLNPDNLGYTISRWAQAFQNDFQARMDWCVTAFSEANHPPHAVLNGDKSLKALEIEVNPGQHIQLNAAGSTDIDGDQISYEWRYYPEPGTYTGKIKIKNLDSMTTKLVIPENASGKTFHILLVIKDNGTPHLTSYRRLVVHCQ